MKINTLNKTITKGVFLASCFAALSLSSLQAADFFADSGEYFNHDYINVPEGGSIRAFNGGALYFSNSTLGSDSNRFVISSTNDLYQIGSSGVYFSGSTIFADSVSVDSLDRYEHANTIDIESSTLNVRGDINISNNAYMNVYSSNINANITGDNSGGINIGNSNINGTINNIDNAYFSGSNTWKTVGSSSLEYITVASYSDLTVDFYKTSEADTLYFGNIYGYIQLNMNFTDEFIEEIIADGGSYLFNIFDTIVGDSSSIGWTMETSNGKYTWEVRGVSHGNYVLDNIIMIPEPSTYAMIFGALALGLAIYRRRK